MFPDNPVAGVTEELLEHLLYFLIGDMLLLSLIGLSAFTEAGFFTGKASSMSVDNLPLFLVICWSVCNLSADLLVVRVFC